MWESVFSAAFTAAFPNADIYVVGRCLPHEIWIKQKIQHIKMQMCASICAYCICYAMLRKIARHRRSPRRAVSEWGTLERRRALSARRDYGARWAQARDRTATLEWSETGAGADANGQADWDGGGGEPRKCFLPQEGEAAGAAGGGP